MIDSGNQGCECVDGLYAKEVSHRAANALQAAMTAIELGQRGRPEYLDVAMRSLTGAASLHRMLAMTEHIVIQAGPTLWNACRAVVASASAEEHVKLRIDDPGLIADFQRLRPLLMIAAELVGNSVRHAFKSAGGRITVTLADDGTHTRLDVEDDGECRGWNRPGGHGRDIVDELAASVGGTVKRSTTDAGSARVVVVVPSISVIAGSAAGSA